MNIKLALITIMTALLLFSCGNSYVLSPEQLEDVLVDMHLAEGISISASKDFRDAERKADLYSMVFAKHDTDKAQFDSSMVYYSQDLAELTEVYARVFSRLEIFEEQAKSGQYALSKNMSSDISYKRILDKDKDLIPYVENEIWMGVRDFRFADDEFKNNKTVNVDVDSIFAPKFQIRFDVKTSSLTSASVDLVIETAGDSVVKTITLPMDTAQMVVFDWEMTTKPDKLSFIMKAERKDNKARFNLNDIRVYNLSEAKHDVSVF